MANRKQNSPYSDLGTTLREARAEQYRSSRQFVLQKQPSFSYSTYADLEKGVSLPSMEQLLEISDLLNIEPIPLLLQWLRVQIPFPELRAVFEGKALHTLISSATSVHLSNPASDDQRIKEEHKPRLENSWIFGPGDLKLFQSHPWLWTMIHLLCQNFPETVPVAEFLPEEVSAREFWQNIANRWLSAEYLIREKNSVRLLYPHVKVPNSPQWEAAKRQNTLRAFSEIVAGEGDCHAITRTLTPEQVATWEVKVQQLYNEFKNTDYQSQVGDPLYVLAVGFGARKLKSRKAS